MGQASGGLFLWSLGESGLQPDPMQSNRAAVYDLNHAGSGQTPKSSTQKAAGLQRRVNHVCALLCHSQGGDHGLLQNGPAVGDWDHPPLNTRIPLTSTNLTWFLSLGEERSIKSPSTAEKVLCW